MDIPLHQGKPFGVGVMFPNFPGACGGLQKLLLNASLGVFLGIFFSFPFSFCFPVSSQPCVPAPGSTAPHLSAPQDPRQELLRTTPPRPGGALASRQLLSWQPLVRGKSFDVTGEPRECLPRVTAVDSRGAHSEALGAAWTRSPFGMAPVLPQLRTARPRRPRHTLRLHLPAVPGGKGG